MRWRAERGRGGTRAAEAFPAVASVYMRGVTSVDPEWLAPLAAATPLVERSQPLESPPPTFDAGRDQLRCWVKPTFGVRRWELPLQQVRALGGAAGAPGHD